MKVLLFSIPRSGTRFWMYFLHEVLGVEVAYAHFGIDDEPEKLIHQADVVIVPTRGRDEVRKSWRKPYHYFSERGCTVYLEDCFKEYDRLIPFLRGKGAIFVDTEKGPNSAIEIEDILYKLGLQWTPEAVAFYREWPIIGSQHKPDDERDEQVLAYGRRNRAKLV